MTDTKLPDYVKKIVFIPESKMILSNRINRYIDCTSDLGNLLCWLIEKLTRKYSLIPLKTYKIKDKIGCFNVNFKRASHNVDNLLYLSSIAEKHMLVDVLNVNNWKLEKCKLGYYLILTLGILGSQKLDTVVAIFENTDTFNSDDILLYKDTLFLMKGLHY